MIKLCQIISNLIKLHRIISNYIKLVYLCLFIHCFVGPAGPSQASWGPVAGAWAPMAAAISCSGRNNQAAKNQGVHFSRVSLVWRTLLRSSQNIYKMPASKKPKLSQTPFWGPRCGPKRVFCKVFAFFWQPFCIYCIYVVYISYIDSSPPSDSIPPVINS